MLILKVLMVLVALFLIGGFTWQALDKEEFPDEELPVWFVRAFRPSQVRARVAKVLRIVARRDR